MGYYTGDYYEGDYYQGGFPLVFGAKLLARTALGKGVGKAIGKLGARAGKILAGRTGKVVKGAGKVAAGGAVFEVGSRAAGRVFGRDEMGMLGYRRRRMNVANPKALRRAIRRAHGFAKLARKVLSFPISKPPKGRPLFKKRGRR